MLKIDKSFVLGMAGDESDAVIVRSAIDLGHNLGLEVVAEGVESNAIWRNLAGLGCDVAQGFYLARPMPSDTLVGWLERHAAATVEGLEEKRARSSSGARRRSSSTPST